MVVFIGDFLVADAMPVSGGGVDMEALCVEFTTGVLLGEVKVEVEERGGEIEEHIVRV